MNSLEKDVSMSHSGPRWILFIFALMYLTGLLLSICCCHYCNLYLFWLIGIIPIAVVYKSHSVWLESGLLPVLWIIVGHNDREHCVFLLLPLVTAVLIYSAYRTGWRFAALLVLPLVALFLFLGCHGTLHGLGALQMYFLIFTVLALAVFLRGNPGRFPPVKGKVDVLLCSHSGNTGHYAEQFIRGMRLRGAEVEIHRFHNFRDFRGDFTGETFILACPISGWKPPWPLLEYLWRDLPQGNGKPAFVLYTAGGAPENAGVLLFLLLTLRGYRVMGRDWAAYPTNVVTLRIGPAALWSTLDRLLPFKSDLKTAERCGEAFAQGEKTGLPFILWPSLLLIPGFLLDNRWINPLAYRMYVWKKRCIKCGLCISLCPAGRLFPQEKTGYPASKGLCTLCLMCINLCPKHAMQCFLFSEYGNPYSPRWPQYTVKGKQEGP